MARLNLMLDTRNKNTDRFPLVIRVSHRSKWKYLPTGYRLSPNEWNDSKKQIKSPYPNAVRANAMVQRKMTIASEVLSEHYAALKGLVLADLIALISARFKENDEEKLPAETLSTKTQGTPLKQYSEKVISRYVKAKRFGTARSIKDAVGLLLRFCGTDDLLISDINETFLEDLEAHYLGLGYKINGLGVRLRSIRRIFNLAIKDKDTELTAADYPFGKSGYSIKTERANKRAVKLDVIKQIRELDYQKATPLWHHRNYFLFMLNMRGMNFIDLAFLPTSAIQNGRLKYKRRKTKRGNSVKTFDIKITEEAQQILNYYADPKNDKGLTFPIMRDMVDHENDEKVYKLYQNRLSNHNRRLGAIGRSIGLEENLTSYVARHTFATAGLRKGISKAQIGDMLGHTNYYTTEAYFDDFEKEVLDDAADQILG